MAYIEEGKLRFAEELGTLAKRFREVELTFDSPPVLPQTKPQSWLQLSASSTVVRFTDSRFDSERTTADIHAVFGEPRNVTFSPMSLRSIFLVMAKSGRNSD